MNQKIFPIFYSIILFASPSCKDDDAANNSQNDEGPSSQTTSNEKKVKSSEPSQSEWDKINSSSLDKVLLEEQVKELFKIEGEIKKSAKTSDVYGTTIAFSWRSDRTYVIDGKTYTYNQPSSIAINIPKVYANATAAKAKQNFDFALKPSSPDKVKQAIDGKRKRDTPNEVDLLMQDGLTAEETKRMSEIMKERAANGATGLTDPTQAIKPTYEKIDDNTRWSIDNETLSVISGTKILAIRCTVSHENEVSKKTAIRVLDIMRKNLEKLP